MAIVRDAERIVLQAVFSVSDVMALLDIDGDVDADLDGDGTLSTDELRHANAPLRRLVARLFVVADGATAPAPEVRGLRLDDSGGLHLLVVFEPVGHGALVVRSPRLAELGLGHRQLVRAVDPAGVVAFEGLLDASRDRFRLPAHAAGASASSPGDVFADFAVLGVEHILIGYDHLAFLIALLIVGGRMGEVGKTITAFTAAHSITLALAALDLVSLPIGAVEAAIALSIVYVGIENLAEPRADRRWLIAFAFGLIHGFGFASVLGELTAQTGGRLLVPLVAFNVGVEIGQVAIAAAVLPLVRRLRDHPAFVARYAPACSLTIAAAGIFWFVERAVLAA